MDNAGEPTDKSLSLSKLNRIDQMSDRFERAVQEAIQSGAPWPEIEDYLGDTAEPLRSELRQELTKVQASLRQQSGSPVENSDVHPASSAAGDKPQGSTLEYRAASAMTDTVGAIIAGRYKLIEEIGEGGMGTVFMAQQAAPVKRLVAVKIVKQGMDSKAVLARFEAERQALALMEHPNIARVLDAGSSESGRPFFVMELVKGIPITHYCDQHRLTPRQRLELFLPVCQAIQHAHQKGVIHRDIKPSNVLVAMYDDKPVPKVIDFGLAKAAGQTLTDKTLITGFGTLVGTPEYMSPEQANLNNLDIDTRSDVYSLGVLLYELLTGTTPVDRKSLGAAALLEILRIVREVEAPRPSTKLSSSDALPSIAANRNIEPARLSRLMKGELDWVLLKALEKDRARRYETANGLARDIERYLSDEIVEARPPSTGYRLLKFARRNRGPMIATSLVLLALLAGMAGTTWGLLEARRSAEAERLAKVDAQGSAEKALAAAGRERLARVDAQRSAEKAVAAAERERLAKIDADAKRKEAETNLAFATKGNEILGSVFEGLDPQAEYATVGELRNALQANLKKAVKELDGAAIGNPVIVATMQDRLGVSLRGLGDAKTAIVVLEKAAATLKAELGPDHPDTLTAMGELAHAFQAAGKLDQALPMFRETLTLTKAKLGPDHPDTLLSMNNLAFAYYFDSNLDLALPLFEETLKLEKVRLGPDHPLTLSTMSNLAEAYRAAGKLDLALPLLEQTLKLIKAKRGRKHPETFAVMNNLATVYKDAGKLDLALPLFEETLTLEKATFGPEHPGTLICMGNLAKAYQEAGKLDLALPLFEEAFRLKKDKLGPDHPTTISSMNSLAVAYQDTGKLDLALPLYEETLRLEIARLGPDHTSTLTTMANLAAGYRDAGKLDLALPLFEKTLTLMRAKLGTDHPDTLNCMNSLANAFYAAGKLDLALPLLEETVKLKKVKLGPDHPDTLLSMNNLAVVYREAGKLDLALPLNVETVRLMEAKLGPNHPYTLGSMRNLVLAYGEAGEAAKAAQLLSEVRMGLPKDSPQLSGLLAQLGFALLKAKAFAEAEPVLRECLAIREETQRDFWATFNTRSLLGGSLLGQKKYADAEPLLLNGYEGLKQREKAIRDIGRIRLPEAIDRLIELYTATNRPVDVKKWQAERAKYPAQKPTEKK
jgi:eukaryotic-like serine/threonine-protein kinase